MNTNAMGYVPRWLIDMKDLADVEQANFGRQDAYPSNRVIESSQSARVLDFGDTLRQSSCVPGRARLIRAIECGGLRG